VGTDGYLAGAIAAMNASIKGKLYRNSMCQYYAIEWGGTLGCRDHARVDEWESKRNKFESNNRLIVAGKQLARNHRTA
jgi:hypothetical protein